MSCFLALITHISLLALITSMIYLSEGFFFFINKDSGFFIPAVFADVKAALAGVCCCLVCQWDKETRQADENCHEAKLKKKWPKKHHLYIHLHVEKFLARNCFFVADVKAALAGVCCCLVC